MTKRPKDRRIPEELTVIDETVSTSGKYAIALGMHYVPETCYDVIALHRVTGAAIRRHYQNKDEAYAFWSEFKEGMTKKIGDNDDGESEGETLIYPN